jgi:hypothetical protein
MVGGPAWSAKLFGRRLAVTTDYRDVLEIC